MRAQANVLKKAVVEEQSKSGQWRETVRLKEVELRRSEQEVDSLSFRNKQLELRVATLQDELEKQQGKQQKKKSNGSSVNLIGANSSDHASTTVVAEEFQKKIIENAQLMSLLADKEALEEKVNSQLFKQSFVEEGLRNEIQELCMKNAALEMKLLEAGGGRTIEDDNHSVTTENSSILAETAPISCSGVGGAGLTEDRLVAVEKELNVLRAKYELLQLQEKERRGADGGSGTAEAAEEILCEHFARKIDDILLEKQLAESKLVSYLTECDSLRDHLEILTDELRDQERQFCASQKVVKTVEDHLTTTRLNYEEQISVLTEQVISLSDQLAAASN